MSDAEHTLVDVLDDPALGAGIRHVAECLAAYFEGTPHTDLLVRYADRLGNRTLFKRLGHLLEASVVPEPELIAACQDRIGKGLSRLDPTVDHKGRILKRWNLPVNMEMRR